MNIVVAAVIIGSIVFLLRFLVALVHEQKTTPRLLNGHMLNHYVAVKSDLAWVSTRTRLRVVEPIKFDERSTLRIIGIKTTQQQKLG